MRGMLSRGYSVLAAALANSSSMAIPHAGHGVRWAGRRSVRRESMAHLRCPCGPDQREVSDAFDELASEVCPALDATGDRPQKPPGQTHAIPRSARRGLARLRARYPNRSGALRFRDYARASMPRDEARRQSEQSAPRHGTSGRRAWARGGAAHHGGVVAPRCVRSQWLLDYECSSMPASVSASARSRQSRRATIRPSRTVNMA